MASSGGDRTHSQLNSLLEFSKADESRSMRYFEDKPMGLGLQISNSFRGRFSAPLSGGC
jgi:hypothetical protein